MNMHKQQRAPAFADIVVGDALPGLTETATNLSTFLVGVAWWTAHRIHYDKAQAQKEGFDDVIVPGIHVYMWIERLLVDWAEDPASLRQLTFRHLNIPYVGDEIEISAVVASKLDDGVVELKLTATRADGVPILTGTAQVALPGEAA